MNHAAQDPHRQPDIALLGAALQAAGVGYFFLNADGSVKSSSPLADRILNIQENGGRRILAAKIYTPAGAPVQPADIAKLQFPAELVARAEGAHEVRFKIFRSEDGCYVIHEAKESAADSQREFLDVVAHDLRAGMVPLKTYAQTLYTGVLGPVNEKQTEALRAIDRCVQKQVDKIAGLLDMIKAEENRLEMAPETVSLPELLQKVAGVHARECGKRGIRQVVNIPAGAAVLEADIARLTRVISDLLSRSMRQTQQGGAVGLDLKYVPAGFARIRIWDTGAGNGPELARTLTATRREQLDAPGAQPTHETEIATVCDIVKAHGGRVAVQSDKGHGTTYLIYLPVQRSRSAQPPPPEAIRALALVSDSTEAEIFKALLEKRGIAGDFAVTAQEAIANAREHHFALVLLSDSDPEFAKILAAIRAQRPEERQAICIIEHRPVASERSGIPIWPLAAVDLRSNAERVLSEMIEYASSPQPVGAG